jgi:hypothetical protein
MGFRIAVGCGLVGERDTPQPRFSLANVRCWWKLT